MDYFDDEYDDDEINESESESKCQKCNMLFEGLSDYEIKIHLKHCEG
jgi:hypothetical protein